MGGKKEYGSVKLTNEQSETGNRVVGEGEACEGGQEQGGCSIVQEGDQQGTILL